MGVDVTQPHLDEGLALRQVYGAETCFAGKGAAEIVADLRIDIQGLVDRIVADVLVNRSWDHGRTDEYSRKALWEVHELDRFGE